MVSSEKGKEIIAINYKPHLTPITIGSENNAQHSADKQIYLCPRNLVQPATDQLLKFPELIGIKFQK